MPRHDCCDRGKSGTVRIITAGKERHNVNWCPQHPVWAMRTVGELMLELAVFPGSQVVAKPTNQGRML